MPELPDIVVYIEAIRQRVIDQPLSRIRLNSPFLLRTAVPPIGSAEGKTVTSVGRIGKRIILGLEGELYLVLHPMVAGRLHWREPNAKLAGKFSLAAFDFPNGSLVLTEAGTKRRASLHLFSGSDALKSIVPGGIDVLHCTFDEFVETLKKENHTLKRSLTDPRADSSSPARAVARQLNVFDTPTTKRTTARPAKRAASCCPIERCPAYSAQTGPKPSMHWSR